MTLSPPITAPQSAGFSPKQFQARIIRGVCEALADTPRAPCLLRSPTGSCKTYMLTRILENVSKSNPVLWLWFVPYVNLVAQTVDTLDSQSIETGLIAKHLIRLVETKHDVKDANRKGTHQSKTYGKVLFLTKDAQRFKIVEDNGSLGEVVDFDNLARLRQWMRDTAPIHL